MLKILKNVSFTIQLMGKRYHYQMFICSLPVIILIKKI